MSSRGGRHECRPLSFGPCDFELCLLALPAITGHKLGRRFDGQVDLHAGVGLEAVPARSGQPAFTDRNRHCWIQAQDPFRRVNERLLLCALIFQCDSRIRACARGRADGPNACQGGI
jgi:hypothetical protein